jgi:uncharacterized cupredoxin-like copper-binding protein
MHKLVILVLVGLTFLLAACSGGAASSSGAQQFTVQVSEFSFQPAAIEVLVGQPVKLTLQNKGTVEHDWSIQKIPVIDVKETGQVGHYMGGSTGKPDLHMSALMGKSAELEFTPTRAGTYQIACTVAGHKEAGMVGTLVVK